MLTNLGNVWLQRGTPDITDEQLYIFKLNWNGIRCPEISNGTHMSNFIKKRRDFHYSGIFNKSLLTVGFDLVYSVIFVIIFHCFLLQRAVWSTILTLISSMKLVTYADSAKPSVPIHSLSSLVGHSACLQVESTHIHTTLTQEIKNNTLQEVLYL